MKKKTSKTLFPSGFFRRDIPEAVPTNNIDDKIIPIKWSKDVQDGKRKASVNKLSA